jgi:hypothetical protein
VYTSSLYAFSLPYSGSNTAAVDIYL